MYVISYSAFLIRIFSLPSWHYNLCLDWLVSVATETPERWDSCERSEIQCRKRDDHSVSCNGEAAFECTENCEEFVDYELILLCCICTTPEVPTTTQGPTTTTELPTTTTQVPTTTEIEVPQPLRCPQQQPSCLQRHPGVSFDQLVFNSWLYKFILHLDLYRVPTERELWLNIIYFKEVPSL